MSLVSVHVHHPPDAAVTIHRVERLRDDDDDEGDTEGGGDNPEGGGHTVGGDTEDPSPPRVLAQSRPQLPGERHGFGPDAGFGYCFRSIAHGECSSPLPGLRTRNVCCRGGGSAWGVHECHPCDPDPEPCPKGFRRVNGSCVDVDECQEGGLCHNGLCTNTRGSFACLCHDGFILDSSRSSCISHQVLSEAKGPCFRVLRDGRCALPTLRNITRQICCCSRVGKAWGRDCLRCPPFGSEGFREICPAGAGYHYAASDLRYNARPLGTPLPRVPLGRPRATARPHGTPQRRPGQPPLTRPPPVTTMSPSVTRVPPRVPEVPPHVIEVPPRVPEVPPRVIEVPPRVIEVPPRVPEVPPHVIEVPPRVPEVPPRVPEVPPRVIEVPPRVPEVPPRVPEMPPHIIEVPQRVPEVPPRVPEVPPRVIEVPPRVIEVPPPGPEVVIVPRPTPALQGPPPTAPPAGGVCERNPQLCGPGRCVPRGGGYTCLCHNGFWLSTQGTHCIDVDECRRSPLPCTHGRCENTVGSFRCVCNAGFRPGPTGTDCHDVDECARSPPPCPHGRCENLPGSFRCVCPSGFRATTHGGHCEDIDECETPTACPGQECVNTAGSFQCRPCRDGFEPHHGRCADVDECSSGSPCGPRGRCVNTEGSFLCQCQRGYRAAAAGAPCEDVNECLEGDFCFPHGECLNADGSYRCLCAQGYTSAPDGTACLDVDECSRGDVCAGGRCVNTDGAFECHCPAGFHSDSARERCLDVDECQEHGPRLCGVQRCQNIPGSYRCVPECPPGYRLGDSGECEDEDECSGPGPRCGAHAACHNLPGSFQCACHQGYEAARHGHHCQDVDECATLPGVCGAARCENVDGSFLCLCPDDGHEFDPVTGTCAGTATPVPPVGVTVGLSPSPGDPAPCYSPACGVLAANVTRQQCCCAVGWAWGPRCHPAAACPQDGSAEQRALCPHGMGQSVGPHGPPGDVDECRMFAPHLCRGGVCVNAAPGFSCYCPTGYYYEREHLQCVDNDECRDEGDLEPCVGGRCVNTVGSYYCVCTPPLVLDGAQRRCVPNDTRGNEDAVGLCWQEVGPDLVCGRPRLDRALPYSECCCLYGAAWGMDCALCPARDSDDFEFLCNALRPPPDPPRYLGPPPFPPPFPPPPYGLPYGPPLPLPYPDPPAAPRPYYPPDPLGGGAYALPPLFYEEMGDFGGGAAVGGGGSSPPRSYRAPPEEEEEVEEEGDPPPGMWGSERMGGGTGDAPPLAEALPPEQCGVLSGCEHGRCVRIPRGFTCVCDRGFRLHRARMACIDIDECSEPSVCSGGRCLNTVGSFRCLCPPGSVPAQGPPRCVPARPRA